MNRGSGARALHFVVPGELGTRTGGYGYDRALIDGLRRRGREVRVHLLSPSFPTPDDAALAHADARLAAIEDAAIVIVDGLAFGVLAPVAERHAARLRLVALVHHPLADETGLPAQRRDALRAAEARALGSACRVLVTGRFGARRVEALGVDPTRIDVVAPGTAAAPLAVGTDRTTVALLTVGTVTPRKGHLLLVEALARLRGLDWSLRIVGSLQRDRAHAGQLRDRIRDHGLAARVELAGELDEAALQQAFARADLYVSPSLFEGWGMALAEALARGLPAVASATGAAAELLEGPPPAGLLFAPGDADALVEALQASIADGDRRSTLALGARAARARLTQWDAAVDALERVLAAIASS